ncbi:MAG: dihydroorotate dehydrogenase electron transfer subunit [Candidatus Omnitrophica bacterium]|nr:dihydroorotate dehydrogenase electron transfer subunit [Candidatus Omnitrophota bacterium]
MKNFQLKAKILAQTKIKDNYWHCEFSAPQIAKNALPGQFINIRVSANFDPLLRRPISLHGVSAAKVKIVYEVVGKATEILVRKKKGEFLDIIGPLGNGFDLGMQKAEGRRQILVAGGMGVAPLMFLAEKLKVPSLVLIGAKTKKDLLCVQEFKKLGCSVKISTDDGSLGFKGRVTELLRNNLTKSCALYACGLKPMLKVISDIANEYNIPAQVSLEEHMSCGIGACLGCVVKTKEGLKRVCQEGPVFKAQDLIW